MAPDQEKNGKEDLTRLTPRRFSGFAEKEESGLIYTLGGKVLNKEDKEYLLKSEGYNLIIKAYADRLKTRKTPGGQPLPRMNYCLLWDPKIKNLPLEYQIGVEYERKESSWIIFETTRKYSHHIDSATLEKMAQDKLEQKFVRVTFVPKDEGKLQALLDLSFRALKTSDLTIGEGKSLVQNSYLIFYLKEELPYRYSDLFCRIEWPQKFGDYLAAIPEVKKALSKFTRELRKKYRLRLRYESESVPGSKEEIKKRLQQKLEEEDTAEDLPG